MVATLDSGADVHVLSYDAALTLFHDIKASRLKVVGVSGVGTAADIRGHLIVTVESPVGKLYRFDLGTAHGLKGCPMNLLSISLLLEVGAVIHFEKGDCWLLPPGSKDDADRVPLRQIGGTFQLPIT